MAKNINKLVWGFTLLEVLIYVSIFAIVLGLLSTILITTTRVEMRESAAAEVTEQSGYVVQTIQRLVRESSQIEGASSTLVLRMASTTRDKTTLSLSGGKVYLQEGSGSQRALTSDKVIVNSLSFQKFSNPPGKDVVEINITMTFNSSNPQFAIVKTLRSAIARVSAATFDSNIVPNANDTYSVGLSNPRWREGYFSGNLGTSGDFYADTIGKGIILKSPSSTCWRLTVNNSGSPTTTSVACPY